MKFILSLFIFLIIITSCSKKDPYIRTNIANKAKDYLALGVSDYEKGNFISAKFYFEEAYKIAATIDNNEYLFEALKNLVNIAIIESNINLAYNYLEKAYNIYTKEKLNTKKFSIYFSYGQLNIITGNLNEAENRLNIALSSTKNELEKALVYNELSIIEKMRNNLTKAKEHLQNAIKINEKKKKYYELAGNYYNLGLIYEMENNFKSALEFYLKALLNDKLIENIYGIIDDLRKIGYIYYQLNDIENAKYYYQKAYESAYHSKINELINEILKETKDRQIDLILE